LELSIVLPIQAQAEIGRDSSCAQAGCSKHQYQPDPAQNLGELGG